MSAQTGQESTDSNNGQSTQTGTQLSENLSETQQTQESSAGNKP